MQSKYINEEDYAWVNKEISEEIQYLSKDNKDFFYTYKLLKPTLYKLENPSSYDDSVFVILIYNNHVILLDDIEELFAVGKIINDKITFNGNFSTLNESIEFLKKI